MNSLFPSMQEVLLKELKNFINSNLLEIIIFFLALFIIWLLIREFLTWYWKINKIVSILEKIEISVDSLANSSNQKDKDQNINETIFIEKPIDDVKSQDTNKIV